MQKKLLVALCAAALSAGLSMNSIATAAEAESVSQKEISVKFNGRVVETTCEISSSVKSNAVELGTYPTAYFDDKRETPAVEFAIEIGKCVLTKSVSDTNKTGYGLATNEDHGVTTDKFTVVPTDRIQLTFTDKGTFGNPNTRNGYMLLTEKGAENVGIRVQYAVSKDDFQNVFDQTGLTTLTASKMYIDDVSNGVTPSYEIPMKASMFKTIGGSNVTAGTVKGEMTVTLNYE